jgi:hypothetical protein
MRILLFIEPLPIRSSLTYFNDVARQFLPLLSLGKSYDIRMFANDATFGVLNEAIEELSDKLIRSTPSEEENLSDFLKIPWATEGLPVWSDLMAGTGEVSEQQIQMLRRIWNLFPFEVIVHWGENGAVTRFLDERPVTRIGMELGCTRPPFFNSIVMDPFGSNGSAVLPKLALNDIRDIVEDKPMSRHHALWCFSDSISAPGYQLQFERLPAELDLRWAGRKIAYLPLQLFDDANLIRFSPYGTLTDVVLDVVPRLCDAGFLTIIKPHPYSRDRKGSEYELSMARQQLAPYASSVVWCSEQTAISNVRLFSLADLVVTVNSSVGFEALYYDKTVVVLGDAVYKPHGVFPSLDNILSGEFDRESYLKAIAFLRRFVLGGYLQPLALRSDAVSFCQCVSLIHQLWQTNRGEPVGFARDYWRIRSPAQQALAYSSMLFGISKPGVSEFAVPAILPLPVSDRDQAPVDAASKRMKLLPMFSVVGLKSYWRACRTAAWIKENWKTDAGRTEVIRVGRAVDVDYYVKVYPDIGNADVDPIEHYALYGLIEGRAPQEKIMGTTPDNFLSQLLANIDLINHGKQVNAADKGEIDNEATAYRVIFARLSQHVESINAGALREWLVPSWPDQVTRVNIIKAANIVDSTYYCNRYPDIAQPGIDPIEHYAYYGVNEGRSPREGIEASHPQALLDILLASVEQVEELPILPEYPLIDDQQRLRDQSMAVVRAAIAEKFSRVAVVAHLYYVDIVPEILERLRAINEPFDLYITLPDWGTRRTQELVRAAYPEALFYPAANRGRDLGPFMDLLPVLIEKDYDAVLKVQTKRGYFRAGKMVAELGELYRHEAFNALIGNSERVVTILEAFRSNEMLNAIGPQPFLLSLDTYPYADGGMLAESVLGADRRGLSMFFAGTMFWVRPSSLRDLTCISLSNFEAEDGRNDGAFVHLVERMFGEAATSQGGIIAAAPVDLTESLYVDPEPQKLNIDAYLSKRLKSLQQMKTAKSRGMLLW